MSAKFLVIPLLLSIFIFAWGSFIYLNFGATLNIVGEMHFQGWDHGAIAAVILPLVLITVFIVAFFNRSFSLGLLIYVVTIIFISFISGIGLFAHRLEGCPQPYTTSVVNNPNSKLGDEWRQELKAKLSRGCGGFRYDAESPQTYAAFIGSFVGDLRVAFLIAYFFVVIITPLAFIGKLIGKWLLK